MPKPSRFRGITLKLSLATCLVGPSVGAQTPSPKSGAAAGDSGDTVPRGASGALVVPPKTEAPAPAPSAPVVKPPVIKVDEGAQYPRDALKAGVRDSVTVILILEIGADGRVRKATIDGAQEGASASLFEAAALEAAQKIQAEPATKNGVPVVSRVKHRYDFKPPPGRLVGRVVDQKTGVGIANVAVRVMVQDGTEQVLTTDEKGQWRSEAVPMGACKVTVTMAGYDEQTVDESVNPGEEANLSVRLAPSVSAVSDGSKKGPEEVVEEVTVQGKRPPREITRRTLEQRELTRIPGTNGDALRALQNLPGVARPPGLAGLLIVRGSSPQSTNVFVDGTLIPLVYHFGGLSSVLPTEMLERIDFFPGNFSAQYGRVTGGVVDVAVRDPRNDGKHHGLVQADLIDTRILAEGPISNTGWKYNVSGRRSWIDTWLKPALTATGAGVTTAPVYYDYQIGAQRDLPKNGNLRFLFFGSDDRLELLIKQSNAQGLGGNVGLHTGFWRFQSRFRQKMGNDTEFRAVGAVGQDVIEFNFGDNKLNISSVPVTARVELSQKLAPGVTANVGMDWLWSPYEVSIRLPPPPRPGEPPPGPGLSRPPLEVSERGTQYRPALYTEFELTPAQGTRIVPGVRLDYARDTKSWDLGPRVVARQDITRAPRTTLKGGAGMFFQPPQPQETNPVFGVPSSKSARAIHYGFGVERELTDHIDLSVEAFYKQLDRFFTNRVGDVAKGRAYGLETLLRYKPDSRFFGWLAYTLSRSVLRDTPDEPERPAQFDQTHILTVLGSYRLGRGWEVGSRFRLVSGNPTTPNSYGFFDENASTYLPLQSYPPFGKRLPAFHQLDVRIDKTWAFPTWKLSAYLDVQNVYNQGNVEGVSYNYNFTKSSYATGIPILPSIGIRGEL